MDCEGEIALRVIRVFDSKDYQPHWRKTNRDSVRAIIFVQGKLAMIRSRKFGDHKFPGGGIEKGESHADTLIREGREETGLAVLPATIREYGKTIIRRKDVDCDGIFEQISYYYTCDVRKGVVGKANLDEGYEIEYGYELVFVTSKEAMAANAKLIDNGAVPWVKREIVVLQSCTNFV